MCTITLEYNPNNALARRKLAALLATGLFAKKEHIPYEPKSEEVEAHRELRNAFLSHSRKSMSKTIVRYCGS
jgi:hypothetical protein